MLHFDPYYFLWIAPALILAFVAQAMVHSAYAHAKQVPARMSGMAASRLILDASGLQDVAIEQIPGTLSDHYDPRAKVLRLSQDIYHGRSLAAVGIAAHEAGHALQDAHNYPLMAIRNLAVPLANFGGSIGMVVIFAGVGLGLQSVAILGLILFSGTAFFQLVNLPVEFDASNRAKRLLIEQGIVDEQEMPEVRRVLRAAALTYVAATLQSVLLVAYYASRILGNGRNDR
ncbi:MAG TPA: zinc metallopeptidase [Pirellulaceae bacterium]|nr:zinc metallopeptidase [Pirellulaceae bacterium]